MKCFGSIVCHDHECAPMILAGGLIVILGLYTNQVSERKVIESELRALFCHQKKKKKKKKNGSRGEVVQKIF